MAIGINGTKVECKDAVFADVEAIQLVLMEPKWNVKMISARVFTRRREVLMEPKWNVKSVTHQHTLSLLRINGTKVECKDPFPSLRVGVLFVLMEPKWNVKSNCHYFFIFDMAY